MNIYKINYDIHGYQLCAISSAETEGAAISVCGIDKTDKAIENVKVCIIGKSFCAEQKEHAHESL